MTSKFFLLSLLLFTTTARGHHRTVLLLIDGFRWDYAERLTAEEVPAFARLRQEGVRTSWVQPNFPSISMPSWTTISTGLYPETHGIVGNYMYHPLTGDEFDMDLIGLDGDTTPERRWWKGHVPLWISATLAGLRTSMYHWSLCQVPFTEENIRPEKCVPYNNVDTIVAENFKDNLRESGSSVN